MLDSLIVSLNRYSCKTSSFLSDRKHLPLFYGPWNRFFQEALGVFQL